MAFTRIGSALESLGLKDQYFQSFVENEIDDEIIGASLKDADTSILLASLSTTVPVAGHRMKFLRAFKSVSARPCNGTGGGDGRIQEVSQGQDGASNGSPESGANGMVKVERGSGEDVIQVPNVTQSSSVSFGPIAEGFLMDIKDLYVNQMKQATSSGLFLIIKDEEELRKVQANIRKGCILKLKEQVAGGFLPSSPQMLEQMVENLKTFCYKEFQGTRLLFKLRQEEDELAVKTALLDARLYYNEEMEKNFNSRDWLPPQELERLHKEIGEAAIEKGKKEVDLNPNQEKQLREIVNSFYKKFEDKNVLKMPKDSYAIGIDLGTTYSCVAVCMKGKVKVIPCDGKSTIPSYVAFNDDHTVSVGGAAKDQAFRRPESTIFDAKRLIGRKFSDQIVKDDMKLWPFEVIDDKGQPKIKIPGHEKAYRPEEISARVLAQLKKMAEDYLNVSVTKAVVTVPAYFNDSQRQATKDAAQIAGLNAIIINEPTAAAVAYYYESHLAIDVKRNVLVFDLGGGTFDVAVLEMKLGKVDVKAIGGDTHLGGEDFDNTMVKHIITTVNAKSAIDLGRGKHSSDPERKRKAAERLRRVRSVCEKQKRALSTSTSTMITIDRIDGSYDLYEPFTREEFENLNLSKFQKCIKKMDKVISDAKIQKSDIDDIVLIGGSTRIPKIRELVTEYFDGKALNSQINADEAVAFGAAIQAALEHGKVKEAPGDCRVSVTDVAPLSLGIEIGLYQKKRAKYEFGHMSVVIPKNTPVPCSKTNTNYSTAWDGQTEATVNVYEGERSRTKDNNLLGKFNLAGIPSAPSRTEELCVAMEIDREGILHVKAYCESSGSSNDITIEAYKGRMSKNEIELAKAGAQSFIW